MHKLMKNPLLLQSKISKKVILKKKVSHNEHMTILISTIVTWFANFDHSFGFFVPEKFSRSTEIMSKGKKLCFYFINNNQQLITCQRSDDPIF